MRRAGDEDHRVGAGLLVHDPRQPAAAGRRVRQRVQRDEPRHAGEGVQGQDERVAEQDQADVLGMRPVPAGPGCRCPWGPGSRSRPPRTRTRAAPPRPAALQAIQGLTTCQGLSFQRRRVCFVAPTPWRKTRSSTTAMASVIGGIGLPARSRQDPNGAWGWTPTDRYPCSRSRSTARSRTRSRSCRRASGTRTSGAVRPAMLRGWLCGSVPARGGTLPVGGVGEPLSQHDQGRAGVRVGLELADARRTGSRRCGAPDRGPAGGPRA